jgi:general secretion pathway protein A
MHWIAPGIETNVAYGTCMLLFGLLVLSVRNRKMANRSAHMIYALPMRGAVRPAPKNKSAQSLRRSTTPGQHSGLALRTGLENTPRERANSKPPKSSANPLTAPKNFLLTHKSDEVKMNSPSFPFVNLDPAAVAEISAFAVSAAASTLQENNPISPVAYGLAEIAERSERAIAVATDPHVADERPQETPIAAEGSMAVQCAIQEVAIDLQAPPVETTSEKIAPTNLLGYFGLQQQPFDVTPDPAYLYFTPSHREALTSLKQGIENFRGFMMLVAEPGMGKTTLLNKLMEELADSARVVFLFQTQCSSRELLCFILNELEVDHTGMDVVAMHRALNQALLEEMLRGRRFVLIVDEAQNLQEPVLETIRLLSDFETTHSKLIQIVLAGQPQIAETLMRDSLVQLRQRIAVLSNLKALTAAETAEYVEHRLLASGWGGNLLFTNDALAQIAESSGGVPRRINNLCFNALLEAFHRGLEVIDADIVNGVAGKLNLESLVRRPQVNAASQQPAAPAGAVDATQLAHALAAALTAEARPSLLSETFNAPKQKPEVVLAGNLTEKVRSQGWSKQHEYRILVSLERDPFSGLPVADRYYCCSMYVDEAQAAVLQTGKPVRIRIEQD